MLSVQTTGKPQACSVCLQSCPHSFLLSCSGCPQCPVWAPAPATVQGQGLWGAGRGHGSATCHRNPRNEKQGGGEHMPGICSSRNPPWCRRGHQPCCPSLFPCSSCQWHEQTCHVMGEVSLLHILQPWLSKSTRVTTAPTEHRDSLPCTKPGFLAANACCTWRAQAT